MLAIIIIAVVFTAAAFSFFMKGAQPKTFDQMPESISPGEVEYHDNIQMVKTSKEPRIRETINV